MGNLFTPDKIDYVTGRKRPDVECILCAIRDRNPDVECLEIFRTGLVIVTLNLYPYNPGHTMIFPHRHICEPGELNADEVMEMHSITLRCIDALKKEYNAQGFNVGINIHNVAGGSIEHLHQHIVPRYPRELGFIDIIGGARIIVEDPNSTIARLRRALGTSG